MTVLTKYYSDRDPETMFDEKSEADAYDLKLERIESLSVIIQGAAEKSSLKLDEATADKIAENMIDDSTEQLAAIFSGKKQRKPKAAKKKPVNDPGVAIDEGSEDYLV